MHKRLHRDDAPAAAILLAAALILFARVLFTSQYSLPWDFRSFHLPLATAISEGTVWWDPSTYCVPRRAARGDLSLPAHDSLVGRGAQPSFDGRDGAGLQVAGPGRRTVSPLRPARQQEEVVARLHGDVGCRGGRL